MKTRPPATERASGPPEPRTEPLRRVTIPVGLGWAFLSASALLAGDPTGIARAAVAAGLVLAVLAVARWRPGRRVMALALAAYPVALFAATVVAGVEPASSNDATRVALFTGNPNDLGAALVVAGAAWMVVAERGLGWAWLWPALGLAVLYTGSRTSGGALLAAFAVWLLHRAATTSRGRSAVTLGVAAVLVAGLGVAWQLGVVQRTPNLLGAPNDLAGHDWRHHLAASVELVDRAGPGPFDGTTAQRLVARAREDGRHLVFQSVGRSELDVPYVASLYLRADTPQRLELSSHLARTTCEVGPEWRRCVTPVGYGDDRLQAQLHLRATEPGGRVDVLVYGAQYEVGRSATPFRDGRPAWLPQSIVRRFDLRRVTALPADRVAIWRAGLDAARDHPWFGVGLPQSEAILLERTGEVLPRGVSYAHNLLVHLLLVHGLVGLVGATLIGGTLVIAAARGGWRRIAPLLVALVLLNTWDLTLFEPEVALPVVVGLALVAAGRSGDQNAARHARPTTHGVT
ncbi:MAG: O-antigen ligase family protein [Trueperaceae bacterium]|nr:O-antigen ligase family protein [Trueperaceae bacterium]